MDNEMPAFDQAERFSTVLEPSSSRVRPLQIGLIVPSSNTVMEQDFHRQLGDEAIVSTDRIFLEDVTREAEIRMLEDELPGAARRIRTTWPDLVVFGCTSAGALASSAHDAGIAELIEKESGARVVTALRAVVMQLRVIGPRKLAVFTPYIEDLTKCIAGSLAAAGYPPVKDAGMGIQANLDIGRVTPAEIISFVESQIGGIHPDCVFLSCTNWQAMETIEPLRKRLGIPVITSNQAAIDVVRNLTQERRHVVGY